MAKIADIRKAIDEMSASEILEVRDYIKSREKELESEANAEKSEQYKQSIRLGDRVTYKSGPKKVTGEVIGILVDKLVVQVEGAERKRSVPYGKILDVSK